MKKIIALLLCIILCLSCITAPAYGAEKKLPFEAGTPGTFWSTVFGPAYDGYANITSVRYELDADKMEELGPKALAKEASGILKQMPEGRRVIQLHGAYSGKYLDNALCGGYIVNPDSVENLRSEVDAFFAELKALDTPIDVIYDDMERGVTPFTLENQAIAEFRLPGEDVVTSYNKHGELYEEWIKNKIINDIQSTPEYETMMKPALEAAGYPFSPNYDLEYINVNPYAVAPRDARFYEEFEKHGKDIPNMADAIDIFGNTMSEVAKREGYWKAVTWPIMEHYPDVLLSNWRNGGTTGEIEVYDFNGNLLSAADGEPYEYLGTPQSNAVFYGYYSTWKGTIESKPPSEWRYDKYEVTKNAFNMLRVDYMDLIDTAISTDMSSSLWISNKGYCYGKGPYYAEAIYHGGLINPTPFIFWPTPSDDTGADLRHLQELFEQLDELCGFEDRKPLTNEVKYVTRWDDRYILTGMYAGGKNVWRITPDLYTAGVTMENFLIDEKTPTFRIGNQNIEFPKGSYIYYPEEDPSEYGYWVISPEGTRPREWRDDKNPMPGPQVPGGANCEPLGYTQKAYTEMPDELDLSRSKEYKAPVVDTTPDDGEQKTDAPPVTDVVVQKLNLNPLRGGSDKEVFLGMLPLDAQNHWARHTLAHMFSLEIMQGSEKGLEPDKRITRAEFLAMLERILGAEEIEFTGEITDIKADDWHATVMQTAVSGGWIDLDVVTGKANPDANITRAEMCDIMVKALSLTPNTENMVFTDSSLMTSKVKENVATIANAGLILGYQDGSFRPTGVLTRAETACLFERLIRQIPELFPEE